MDKSFIFFLTIILLMFFSDLYTQDNSGKILFLDFKFVNGVPQLTKMKAVDGRVKKAKYIPAEKPGFMLKIVSKESNVLYSNNITADQVNENVYEYPGEKGEIKTLRIQKDTTFVTLRVPYSEDMEKIQFYKTSGETNLRSNPPSPASRIYEFIINHSLIEGVK